MKLGLKRPKTAQKEDSALASAKAAVRAYEEKLEEYHCAKEEFADLFPEAVTELQHLDAMKEEVLESVKNAKYCVSQVRETVGPFKCTRAFSKPGYDADALFKVLMDNELKDLAFDLMKVGVISSISLDKESAQVFFDRNAEYEEVVGPTWRDRQELSPRVSVPKV